MRETSLCDKMIDGNWVSKRKRKQVTFGSAYKREGTSLSSESLRDNDVKQKLKGDANISQFANKKKGSDGYYFECVECDLGGNLLCCNSCPRTYHLECLKPPLKRTPPGRWQCPHCTQENDLVKILGKEEGKLSRTNDKSSFQNSVASDSSPGPDKASKKPSAEPNMKTKNKQKDTFHTENAYEGKSPECSEARSARSKKHSGSIMDNSIDGISEQPEDVNENCRRSPHDRGEKSPKKRKSFVKMSHHEKPPEAMPESSKSETRRLKFIVRCHQSTEESNKKKVKISKKDRKKITAEVEGHDVSEATVPEMKLDTKKKKKAKVTKDNKKITAELDGQVISEMSNPESKIHSKSTDDLSTRKKELKMKKGSNLRNHEISPVKESVTWVPGVDVDSITKCSDSHLNGSEQVDRVLGCRLLQMSCSHTQKMTADSCPSQTKLASLSESTGVHPSSSFHNHQRIAKQIECPSDDLIPADFIDEKNSEFKVSIQSEDFTAHGGQNLEEATGACKDHNVEGTVENLKASPNVVEIAESVEKIPAANLNAKLAVPSDSLLQEPSLEARIDNATDKKNLDGQPGGGTQSGASDPLPHSVLTDNNSIRYEFLVKWVGRSNIHNTWISENDLKVLAKRKLENYKAKYGTAVITICEEQWCIPQRILALRTSDGTKEVLVKWRGLPYDDCTWESLDESVIVKFAHLITEFQNFESKCLNNDDQHDLSGLKGGSLEVLPLLEQPKELQGGMLFPHQLEAVNWLRKCWHKSKNVILADEMGLGKTVSACGFISSLYSEFSAKLPTLVLVPLSTLPNWMAEFALWTPHLNVVEYHGGAKARAIIRQYEWHASHPNGERKSRSYKFNVLLTTYEMVLADSSHLRGVPWEVLVVDEGHRLKNSESKLFNLLNSFSFEHRVLLTGTPLQNNIGEMYNLLNFLQPTSFPSLSAFEEKFTELTSSEKVEELKNLVAPHMLRRLKKDAMQNIPPKTERIVPVELSSIQAEYYRAMLTKNYQILRNIGKGGTHQSLLNIVMQLRKVCNHPYLIPGTEPESGSVEFLQEMRIKASGKLALLHSMLKILSKEGHRVLIFSQMTKLLDILEDYLTIEFGPKTFERVDGSVSVADRQAAIARFNQDESRFVFLLSTRSCGLGINLATADTVVIYDSDFNPHADIQAMNRAHRIGQSKRLLVYRLVVRASVEERILQLAKKKLMLDQLFINKSESQKEVQEILRWGTEELFRENERANMIDQKENSSNISEAIVEEDFKQRRRCGGLGDVYQDKCTDDSSKIVWDENSILKLLDRSDIQSAVSESLDVNVENDMLGSVKTVEWNDEPVEEPGSSDLLSGIASEPSEACEAKGNNASNAAEEDEWDRLLRVRWEKYQIEEEEALGRGKRTRKAISYKETIAPLPTEPLGESGVEDEEPERVYTPAGRALKDKYAKLRARQKELLVRRHVIDNSYPSERRDVLAQTLLPQSGRMDNGEHASLEDGKIAEPLGPQYNSIQRTERSVKHGYRRPQTSNLHLSASSGTYESLSIHPFQNLNYSHLPVLGLCAPNANQVDLPRNFQSFLKLPPPSRPEHSRENTGIVDLPLASDADANSDLKSKEKETFVNPPLVPNSSVNAVHLRPENIVPESYFPFSHLPTALSKGNGPFILPDPSASSFSAFQEKMLLPNLGTGAKSQPQFPLSYKHSVDLSPTGPNMDQFHNSIQNLPNISLIPDFTKYFNEIMKHKHQMPEPPPALSLGLMSSTHSSLPENHKKVLDNIMMRTGFSRNKFLKKRLKVDVWSEDELDALWIGVRRHGRGNWDVMISDPKLKFAKHRSPDDLSLRWAEEQQKLFDFGAVPAPKSSAAPFPGIPDGIMNQASLGTDGSQMRSHITDIQLGSGDLISRFPNMDSKHIGLVPPVPIRRPDKLGPNFHGDFGVGPSDRASSLNLPLDFPIQHNPSSNNSFASTSMGCIKTPDAKNAENEFWTKYNKLPNLLNRPLDLLQDPHNTLCSGENSSRLTVDFSKKQSLEAKEDASCSSKVDNLPHWLREAVNISTTKPAVSQLPPTVSAIAQSVRLLYGVDRPTIPPFTVPDQLPNQPKDPRKFFKRKKQLSKFSLLSPECAGFTNDNNHAASSSNSSALNLNLNMQASLSLGIPHQQSLKSSSSTEVFHSVASSVVPGPIKISSRDDPSPNQKIEQPVQMEIESSDQTREEAKVDHKDVYENNSRNSFSGETDNFAEQQVHLTDGEDSSKIHQSDSA